MPPGRQGRRVLAGQMSKGGRDTVLLVKYHSASNPRGKHTALSSPECPLELPLGSGLKG